MSENQEAEQERFPKWQVLPSPTHPFAIAHDSESVAIASRHHLSFVIQTTTQDQYITFKLVISDLTAIYILPLFIVASGIAHSGSS